MISFIHIADKNQEASICKNGLKMGRRKIRGVYAIPVVPDYATTHQWARELKRRGVQVLICVQFRIPNTEIVLVGQYNGEKIEMIASEAVATVLKHSDPMGLEVLIPRKIAPSEITRIYLAPRLVGWRYYPSAKGKKPFCHCRYCNRGEIRASRLIREES